MITTWPDALVALGSNYSYRHSLDNKAEGTRLANIVGARVRELDDLVELLTWAVNNMVCAGPTNPEEVAGERWDFEAYYPRYTQTPPSVVAEMIKYSTIKATITGAVENPGVYELRNDQRSVVSLIMAAGGIVKDGAAVISIVQPTDEFSFGGKSRIRLSYRSDFSGTVGTVIVRDGLKLIYSEKIDVTDYLARAELADKLLKVDSSINGGAKLYHLAGV